MFLLILPLAILKTLVKLFPPWVDREAEETPGLG
jgi:hypothetical protein